MGEIDLLNDPRFAIMQIFDHNTNTLRVGVTYVDDPSKWASLTISIDDYEPRIGYRFLAQTMAEKCIKELENEFV